MADEIIVPDCQLVVVDKQEVPSQRDGLLVAICTEIRAGESVAPDRLISLRVDERERHYRRLREGDAVAAGQLVALLDDKLARDNLALKAGQVRVSQAELEAAEKARDEAKERYLRQLKLHSAAGGSATSDEELGGTQLSYYKAHYDAVAKKEALALAKVELHQAQTILDTYEIRTAIAGVIHAIHKKPGEAVKGLEPLLEIRNPARLRAEGMVDVQYLRRLCSGLKASVEAPRIEAPRQTFEGHLGEITGVAVATTAHGTCALSSSDDGSVRVWDLASRRERRLLRHASPVRALAYSSTGTTHVCATGCADGTAWIWDLDRPDGTPLCQLQTTSHAAVSCVAFSGDCSRCATGGDDHNICVWDVATGSLRCRFPEEHLGALTWLQFRGCSRLFSAGRDNTLRVWAIQGDAPGLERTFEHRSGEVTQLDVSADGKHVLFDHGSTLHVLNVDTGLTETIVQSPRAGSAFMSFARFSPDSSMVLTAGSADGRMQLWRLGGGGDLPTVVTDFLPPQRCSATCAAFAADGSWLISGTRERQVLVWRIPGRRETDGGYPAELSLVEGGVDSNARQVRVWADLLNTDGRLIPGTRVSLRIRPEN
jgi:WD40 repeat protein